MKRIVPITWSRLMAMYRDHLGGMTLTDLKEAYGHTVTSIRNAFAAENIQIIQHPKRQHLILDEKLVKRMHRDHIQGMRMKALERKYKRCDSNIRKAFERRGLPIIDRGNSGCFQKTVVRKTRKELISLARSLDRVKIPDAIRWEWREWPMEKRRWFIETVRAHLKLPTDRPSLPFSSNVRPFEYWTPEARVIAANRNEGRSSREWATVINPCSQGVIWEGELWFWYSNTGYQIGLPWHPAGAPLTPDRLIWRARHGWDLPHGRPALHQVIFLRHHGEIPPGCVVRHLDGNPNNLDPANLTLATRNDVARENQAAHLAAISRQKTAALLKLSQKGKENGPHGPTSILRRTRRR